MHFRTLGPLRSLLTNNHFQLLNNEQSKGIGIKKRLRNQVFTKRGNIFPRYEQLLQRVPRQDLREHQCYYNPNGCF